MKLTHLRYQERANTCQSAVGKKLLQLMDEKQTNLCLSADVTRADDLLALAAVLGPEICVLKTHIDIIDDFTPALTHELSALSLQHQFLIFEDRKFADIGNTVKHQYEGGIYKIADWADLTNAHSLPGAGIIEGLAATGRKKNRGLILLAEMSSAGHLMDQAYRDATLNMAAPYSDFVVGFVSQHALSTAPGWIYFTPGVKLSEGGDALGQQYVTPARAILENGADVIIVGRGIIAADDKVKEAKKYREAGWVAYLERCQKL